ncbi:MAG: T9SS type A sorting domain-containing protein [Saprospiraceae bacterium]|nr:T9SS type A sorting domain-containing protein [Saprospiraceae bacterium]
MKALVIQFTKNRLISAKSVSQYDSYVNFQLWFYEDGVMEIHFGDFNLDNSPNYVPGEGFYLITSDGQKINIGPEMGIRHPTDEEDQTWINGKWNDFDITTTSGYLRSIPTKGFVIRFSKKNTSVADVMSQMIKISPNPSHGSFFIDFPYEINSAVLYGVSNNSYNHLVKENNFYDISHLPSGMYILKLHSGNQIFTTKIIKI